MKLIQIITIVLLFLFVLGCGGGGKSQVTYNFKQGYGNLMINFLDNAPPKKIYQDSNFRLIVELDNQAAYDLKNGVVKIVGVDSKMFGIAPPLERNFPYLIGRSLTSPNGEKIYQEFTGGSGQLFENAERYQNPFFVKVSFNSIFEFTDTICINPNLYAVYDSGCKSNEKIGYSGQGAPVAVTEVESIIYPSSAGAEVEFRIMVRNRGNGLAGFIQLEKAELGGKELKDCKFQSSIEDPGRKKVLFYKDKQEDMLICKTFLPDQKSYMTVLALDFSYDYEIKKENKLTLIK